MELPTVRGSMGGHISRVLKRIDRRPLRSSRALTASEAPSALGFSDVNHIGNFTFCNGRRRPIAYGPTERLAVNVPYNKLEAFPVGGKVRTPFFGSSHVYWGGSPFEPTLGTCDQRRKGVLM